MKLDGKIAVVTGGRGGIGRAIVKRFLKEGATVYAADLTEQGSLDKHDEDGSHFAKLDVTSETDAKALFQKLSDEHGRTNGTKALRLMLLVLFWHPNIHFHYCVPPQLTATRPA